MGFGFMCCWVRQEVGGTSGWLRAVLGAQAVTRLGIVGDLGQTEHSQQTVAQMRAGALDAAIIVGDLSYADCDQASHRRRRLMLIGVSTARSGG